MPAELLGKLLSFCTSNYSKVKELLIFSKDFAATFKKGGKVNCDFVGAK